MIHWTDIEKSKEGILQILHAEDIAQKVNPERLRFAFLVTSVLPSLRKLSGGGSPLLICFHRLYCFLNFTSAKIQNISENKKRYN